MFIAVGGLAIAGGLLLAMDDPGGLALSAFGVVFAGIGWLIRRKTVPPQGQKAVVIGEDAFSGRRKDGQQANVRRGVVIHVDEDASAAEVAAAKADWARQRFAERPDWIEGRILAESERSGGLHMLAAALWIGFALLTVGASLIWGGVAWLVAAGACGLAAILSGMLVFQLLRRRKFGDNVLVLGQAPLRLGQVLEARVLTQLPHTMVPAEGFQVRLRCQRRWEESTDLGPTTHPTEKRLRVETLWEGEAQAAGVADTSRKGNLNVPVRFAVPGDLPATTLSQLNMGIFWDLRVEAKMPGLDFATRFVIPVLDAGTEVLP